MKWIYYIVVFFIIGSIFTSLFYMNVANSKETGTPKEKIPKHSIKIAIPKIEEKELNEIVSNKIATIKASFLHDITNNFTHNDLEYTLYINSYIYEYKNYKSVLLEIEEYTQGAHPDTRLWTYIYDIKNKKEITLDAMLEKNPNYLQEISKKIQTNLLYRKECVDTNWMMEGTNPRKENYQYFVFTPQGILFFFPPYQIAPYSEGIINVLINY